MIKINFNFRRKMIEKVKFQILTKKQEHDSYHKLYQELYNQNYNSDEKFLKLKALIKFDIEKDDTILFIDEIQQSENLISDLKYLCEKHNDINIILEHGNDESVYEFSKRKKVKYLGQDYTKKQYLLIIMRKIKKVKKIKIEIMQEKEI